MEIELLKAEKVNSEDGYASFRQNLILTNTLSSLLRKQGGFEFSAR
jgi:hypothetical protein